jgi:hypothetical protein
MALQQRRTIVGRRIVPNTLLKLTMRIFSLLQAVILVAPALSGAQGVAPAIPSWPVPAGARVRVSSPVLGDKQQVGVVLSATRDTLTFRAERQPAYTSISTSDIRQLEISQGARTHRLLGGLVGFPLGAVAGGFIGAATVEKGNGNARVDSAILGAAVGGLLGAVAGALIIGRTVDSWLPVAVPVP